MQMIICSTRVRVIPSDRASDTVTFLRFPDERIRDVQGHLKVTVEGGGDQTYSLSWEPWGTERSLLSSLTLLARFTG